MPAAELDLPNQVTAEKIRRRVFATVRRGFDPDQVRHYLGRVADQVEELEQEAREARLEAEAALRSRSAPQHDLYVDFSSRMADVIRAADREAERLVAEAWEEAERVIRDARTEAARMKFGAGAPPDDLLPDLLARRESVSEQLQTVEESLSSMVRELEAVIDVPVPPPAVEAPAAVPDTSVPIAR